uniref:Alpha-sarcoglycan n=1 Tax=Anas platyrhynchos TaxID=8839 RepID=A0A8B9SRZ0_ANAPL
MDMCVWGSGAGQPHATLAGGGGQLSPNVPPPPCATPCCRDPLCTVVCHRVLLCPHGARRAPLCPAIPSCAPLCPPVPPHALLCPAVPHRAPLHPIVPHCAPLCPVVPSCARRCPAMRHPAPSCPTVPHCVPLCPVVSHCAPSCPIVPHHVPLCPILSHCAPAATPAPTSRGTRTSPPRAEGAAGSHHAPLGVPAPPQGQKGLGGTRPGWQEVAVAGSPPCPRAPNLGPPGPASPAAAVTQALAPLPVKMEAPELLRVWVLAALVLGGTRAALPDHHVSLETGAVFVHELERELFQEAFLDEAEDDDDAAPITFHAHLLDHPDLPRWLRFAQRGAHQPGFLYGSPTATEVGTHIIEVSARPRARGRHGVLGCAPPGVGIWHPRGQGISSSSCRCWRTTGSPTRRWHSGSSSLSSPLQVRAEHPQNALPPSPQCGVVPIGVSCVSTGGEPPFQSEFLVGNRNVEELLLAPARELFGQAAAGVWEQSDLSIINVTSALDRGGRVPLPIEGRKEGVYVKVGSHHAFSPCLAAAASPQSRFLCRLGQQPLASCYDTFAPHFAIRWCNLTLLEVLPTPTTPGPLWGPGVLEDGGDFQPPTESPPQDLLPGFLLTLLVPLVVAALLCLLLGHLMCCRREGVHKRDLETSDIQLVHHSTIHGDTEELRSMASSRDVPRPLSTLPMFNVRTGQRINPMPGRGDGARAPLIPQQR